MSDRVLKIVGASPADLAPPTSPPPVQPTVFVEFRPAGACRTARGGQGPEQTLSAEECERACLLLGPDGCVLAFEHGCVAFEHSSTTAAAALQA